MARSLCCFLLTRLKRSHDNLKHLQCSNQIRENRIMKTKREREELIQNINLLLHQAYDNTLDEIYAELKRMDDMEDEEDLIAVKEAREDIRLNGTVTWEEVQNEIKKDVA